MKALTFYSDKAPIGEIDLVIDAPLPYDELKARAMIFEVEGETVPVVSIEDLIKLKLHAGRAQDLADADHLQKVLE